MTTIRPLIPMLTATDVEASAKAALETAGMLFDRIAQVPPGHATPENTLDAWDAASIVLEDAFGTISILTSVHPHAAVRNAGDGALLAESSFLTELFQREDLLDRVRGVNPRTPPQRQLQKDLLESFEDRGVALPPEKRNRFREISDRLAELAQEFSKNLRENRSKLRFTPAECEGLPQSWLDRVERDHAGNVLAGFDTVDYLPFMMNARDEDARRRYYVAHTNRGTPANVDILAEIVGLRHEIAELYALPSYAHYITRRRMVETPETVARFLADVRGAVTEAEIRDLGRLAEMKAVMTGAPPEATAIRRWDVNFYRERLREKLYDIDQEALRTYFPTPASVSWMLDVSSRLYGVRFEKVDVPVWHDEVVYFDVSDSDTGRFLGGIYLDLHPRDGKYKHAAAWPVRGVSRKAGRTPISVLVTNFDRKGLTQDELETLLHEFGHVLHGVLSDTEYLEHAGTSVERDFVEAPSQMFEEWASRIESLSLLQTHCHGCPPIDEDLVARLRAARRFGAGMDYGRQLLYASYDMQLSGESPGHPLDVWRSMEEATPLGHVEGTAFPGTFEHIASGYAAGYYGYMWAKVIALDMVGTFGADLMNSERGGAFRQLILSRGSEEPAREIVERFLGRPVSSEAFFARIVGEE